MHVFTKLCMLGGLPAGKLATERRPEQCMQELAGCGLCAVLQRTAMWQDIAHGLMYTDREPSDSQMCMYWQSGQRS